jgi:hypothetical protein
MRIQNKMGIKIEKHTIKEVREYLVSKDSIDLVLK